MFTLTTMVKTTTMETLASMVTTATMVTMATMETTATMLTTPTMVTETNKETMQKCAFVSMIENKFTTMLTNVKITHFALLSASSCRRN